MLFKRMSALQKALNRHNTIFINWERDYYKSDCVEEYIYKNYDITIIFQEDLREHIVNLTVTHTQKKIIKVHYRNASYGDNLIGIMQLNKFLIDVKDKNNIENDEVNAYIDFLKSNYIL